MHTTVLNLEQLLLNIEDTFIELSSNNVSSV